MVNIYIFFFLINAWFQVGYMLHEFFLILGCMNVCIADYIVANMVKLIQNIYFMYLL